MKERVKERVLRRRVNSGTDCDWPIQGGECDARAGEGRGGERLGFFFFLFSFSFFPKHCVCIARKYTKCIGGYIWSNRGRYQSTVYGQGSS